MRRDCSHLFPLISILLLFPALSYGQAWSGILSPSRAIDWSKTGLPATFPDGETTTNPWTPPNRSVCTTIGPSVSTAQINSAISGCAAGTVVVLNAGTYNLSGTITLKNNVTVRGAGASSTLLKGVAFQFGTFGGASSGWSRLTSASSNFTRYTNQITVSGGSAPSVGLAWLAQCNTGLSATDGSFTNWNSSVKCGGSYNQSAALHSLFICGPDSSCAENGGGDPNPEFQQQWVYITNVTGSGPWVVTFTPGLYMQNWDYSRTATLAWGAGIGVGMGLEDLSTEGSLTMMGSYASWTKGVRVVQTNASTALTVQTSAHCLVANSYIQSVNSGNTIYVFQDGAMGYGRGVSDTLFLNNIILGGLVEGGGSNEGNVYAFNYIRDNALNYALHEFEHEPGSAFLLREGNETGNTQDDDTWGSHTLNTWFRNYYMAADPNGSSVSNLNSITIGSWARFENIIGNALGGPGSTSYEANGYCGNYVYCINKGDGTYPQNDATTSASLMRWGNYAECTSDSTGGNHCNTVSWDSGEVPTSISGTDGSFNNPVPSNYNLPSSFFMNNIPFTASSGGTGLSWWKTCTAWNTFPTSCGSYTTQPFPPIGPDVTNAVTTGIPNISGHAWDIPAALAWNGLPVDTSYSASPNVLQFDERVYTNDSAGTVGGLNAPSGLTAVVQ